MELTWKKIKEKEQEETNRRFRRFAMFLILVIIITVAFSLTGYLVYLNVKTFRQLEKEKAKTENVLRKKAGEAYGQFIPLYNTRIQQEQIVREKI